MKMIHCHICGTKLVLKSTPSNECKKCHGFKIDLIIEESQFLALDRILKKSSMDPSEILLDAEPCKCLKGSCLEGNNQHECVNYLARISRVGTQLCSRCKTYTWHQKGECLRCRHLKLNRNHK